MAIKSLIQTFATFLGYELPDSSGQSGNILDSMDDSMGGISSGIDDVNSGLDGTNDKLDSAKKKAKELSGALGIDELHTFGKNTDDDSDSGKDKDNGVSAGYIDPRILKALEDMNYLFDGVRMKAQDIKDAILGWVDNIGKIADENIFEPIRRSWDKYGTNFMKLNKEQWSDLGHIILGVVDVVKEKWKSFFQAFTDLYFSVEETFQILGATMTNILRIVWDNGGKYLFEKIWDLATAFLNLATAINDRFVKPLLYWFKDNIAPVIGEVLGFILARVGDLLSGLANIMNFITSNEGALKTFLTIVGTLAVSWKTTQMLAWINKSGGVVSIIKSMITSFEYLIYKRMKPYVEAGESMLSMANKQLKSWKNTVPIMMENIKAWASLTKMKLADKAVDLKYYFVETYERIKDVTKSLLESIKAWKSEIIIKKQSGGIDIANTFKKLRSSIVESTKSVIEWVKNLVLSKSTVMSATAVTEGMSTASLTAANSTGILSKALAFLSANPIVALIGAIGLVVGGLVAWTTSQSKNTDELNKSLDAIDKQRDKANENAKAITDANKQASDAVSTLSESFLVARDSVKRLKEMTGKNGIVSDIEQAKVLAQQINDILPESVKITNDGKIAWKENTEAILDNMNALINKQRVEEYSKAYGVLLRDETKILGDHKNALNQVADTQQKINELNEQRNKGLIGMGEYGKKLDVLNKTLNKNNKFLKDQENHVTQLREAQKNYNAALSATSTNAEKAGIAIAQMDLKLDSANDGTYTWDSLSTAVAGYSKKLEDNKNGLITLTKTEKEQLDASKKYTLDSCAKKAVAYNKSYKDMIDELKKNGVVLSSSEEKLLKDSYDKFKDNGDKKTKEFQKTQETILKSLQDSNVKMDKETKDGYTSMLNALNDYDIKVDSKNTEIYKKMYDILQKSGVDMNTEQKKQYTQFLGSLQENGVSLSTEQANQYASMFGLFNKYGVDMSNEQNMQHVARLIKAAADGKKEGTDFVNALKKGTGSKNIDPEVARIMENAGIVVKQNKLDVGFDIENPTGRIGNLMKDLTKTFNGNNLLGIGFDIISSGLNMITAKKYATGGFPSVGELFIANEKGPEMLGKMGNRNVVANNNQIVDGIEGGVEGGVTRGIFNAFSMMNKVQNNNGDGRTVIENHIHLDVDGRELAEVIDEVKSKDGFDFGMGRK